MSGVSAVILRRVALALLTLWLVSLLVFAITALLPGDAAQEALGQGATAETVAALRVQLGLDQPAWLRYAHWLGGLLAGQPGESLANHLPVAELIGTRLPRSLVLAGCTAAVSVPLALLLGIWAAVRRGSLLDRALSLATLSLVAVPEFLVAALGVLLFAVKLHWLPALASPPKDPTAGEFVRAYALPVMTLGFVITAQMARMTRAAVIEQLGRPYVEMALLKGLAPGRIVLRHVLPNAVGPIANAMALSLSYLLGGVIIVETVFNYPGLASLMVDAVTSRDMPLLQSCAMLFCGAYLLLVLIADVCAIASNPRLRR